ncbi:hypothetical protein [Celeribacter arenosi]|uniref:Lipoprotein n=1 Tax=Celeribacter arenosi TaxID=792649 RepID=A0ABP7K9U7_9RHOB
MRVFPAILVMALLVGCQSEQTVPDYGLAGYNPNANVTAKSACDARGGDYLAAGEEGLLVCFTTPRDAGKACKTSSDCESACLARSQSCAPVQPLIGCNDILDAAGRRVTQCVD